MSEKGEFGFIGSIASLFSNFERNNIEGIGDDCAVIPTCADQSMVITTDMLVEDVHFLRSAISARELGRKSLAVNLSDVAAMGARPIASLLSISLPAECTGEWADEFMLGYHELSAQHGVNLIGGDTTSSHAGVTINVVAIGTAHNNNIKRRIGAQAGDRILVNGVLGESAAGLRDVLAGHSNTAAASVHHNPTAQVAEGIWLGTRTEVSSMMDISDGVASDLAHILKLSNVEALVHTELIPTNYDLETAVCGGEDFFLLLTAKAESTEQLKHDYKATFGSELYEIGKIITNNSTNNTDSTNNTKTINTTNIHWLTNGIEQPQQWHGFTHF